MYDFLKGLTGWQYVLAFGILTGLSFLGAWGKIWLEKLKLKAPVQAINGMAQIYDCLNELCAQTGCARALILYTSNGGGIPTTKTPVYSTILYEAIHEPLHPIRQNFQQVPLDDGYVRMMNEVTSQDTYAFDTEKMPKGFLRDMYEQERAVCGRMTELARTPDKFYFLCVRWTHKPTDAAQIEIAHRTIVPQLRNLLK